MLISVPDKLNNNLREGFSMIVLIVYGIPDSFPEEKLKKFWSHLFGAVRGINAHKVSPDEIYAFFPRDIIQEGLGEEIIIFVNDFSGKLELEEWNRKKVAEVSGKIAKTYFPGALVKVKVCLSDPGQTLWSSA